MDFDNSWSRDRTLSFPSRIVREVPAASGNDHHVEAFCSLKRWGLQYSDTGWMVGGGNYIFFINLTFEEREIINRVSRLLPNSTGQVGEILGSYMRSICLSSQSGPKRRGSVKHISNSLLNFDGLSPK